MEVLLINFYLPWYPANLSVKLDRKKGASFGRTHVVHLPYWVQEIWSRTPTSAIKHDQQWGYFLHILSTQEQCTEMKPKFVMFVWSVNWQQHKHWAKACVRPASAWDLWPDSPNESARTYQHWHCAFVEFFSRLFPIPIAYIVFFSADCAGLGYYW